MDPKLLSYMYCFNVLLDYYECHEYGEHLWLETGRPIVLKGLIQSAVCLYHLLNGNVKGGWAMWQRARQYIAPSRPIYQSINLDKLTADIDDVFAQVPSDWYDQVVPSEDIAALQLPTVRLDIVDDEVLQNVSNWDLSKVHLEE